MITENKKTQEVLPDADPGQLVLLKSYCFDWNREPREARKRERERGRRRI